MVLSSDGKLPALSGLEGLYNGHIFPVIAVSGLISFNGRAERAAGTGHAV